MNIKNLFNYMLFSTFALSILSFSPISAEETVAENSSLASKCCKAKQTKKNRRSRNEFVFATYRSDFSGIVNAGQNIPFTMVESNRGKGVQLNPDSSFTILKSGVFLISAGVQSAAPQQNPTSTKATLQGDDYETPFVRGINLIQINQNCGSIVRNRTQVNVPLTVALFLSAGDIIQLSPQQNILLVPGSLCTNLVDTAFISFARVDATTTSNIPAEVVE